MSRILAVGIATLDIINEVERYPHEDQEVRALTQQVRRGGNATNTLVVLSQLGHRCSWAGVLVDEPDGRRVRAELDRYAIDCAPCRMLGEGKMPTSYITLSRQSGSRSIVHFRNLPEYAFEDFARVELAGFDWVHFEARNAAETRRMLERIRREHPGLPCSLEVEKPRDGLAALLPLPDVIIYSRAFARQRGFADPHAFLDWAQAQAPRARLFLGWGEHGAYASSGEGVRHQGAYSPARIVDTLGAGDVLNAGIIDGLVRGLSSAETLSRATRLAGHKCARHGLDALGAVLDAEPRATEGDDFTTG